jgi:hypothetical protein
MSERVLLPGEQEAWERACRDERWVARITGPKWWTGDFWSVKPSAAALRSMDRARGVHFPGETLAYRARSVRADGSPVVP